MQNLLKELFEWNVIRHFDRIAIEAGDCKLTYSDFAELVHSIEKLIRDTQIQNKAIIVFNDQSVYSYASILAINFSGNTVLPIELKWPKKRISDIVEKVKPAGIINSDSNRSIAQILDEVEHLQKIYIFDATTCSLISSSKYSIEFKNYTGITYIISTSGSTGIPKGVPVKQESIHAFIEYHQNFYDFNEQDRFLQVYDITFDVAYFSFFIPLCFGACCCVLTQHSGIPKYLSIIDDLINREITVISMVPTALHFIKRYLKNRKVRSVRYSFFSGDSLYQSEAVAWHKFLPDAQIHNFYGPTETTIVCTRYIWQEDVADIEAYNGIVPIGRPFPGMQFIIVDENNRVVKQGVTGELAFNGIQVIEEYLDGEHEDKFFTVNEGGNRVRYYKTGDLVKLNTENNLVFHGRTDHQVKINGYRIELDEVQTALSKVAATKCIVVKMEENNVTYLRAVLEGPEMDVILVKERLANLLPAYMIPNEIIFIPEIPLNENGKVNKKELKSL